MDDGHVGAEFLRKSEECECGTGDDVIFGSKKGPHTLSWNIIEQHFHIDYFMSIGAEILRRDVQSRPLRTSKSSVEGALAQSNEWLMDMLVQSFSKKVKSMSVELTIT